MGSEEPVFVARHLRLAAPPRFFKERHVQLKLAQGGASGAAPVFAALGWNWAERVRKAGLDAGAIVDVAFRLRENEPPDFGGLELEMVDLAPAQTAESLSSSETLV